MRQRGHETFEHEADIGIRGYGESLEEAFAEAARAMFAIMAGDLEGVPAKSGVAVEASGYDLESLFVAFLNELLAKADLEGVAFSGFDIAVSGLELSGTAYGAEIDYRSEDRGVEVKGATYSQVRVEQKGGIWTAQCVVDV
jgi:SHS2 domain-containing protein